MSKYYKWDVIHAVCDETFQWRHYAKPTVVLKDSDH